MVAAFDFCLPRQGRRGAVDRHGHARPGRPPPTSTTSTPTAASPSPPRPTASSSPRTSSATRSLWVPWRRPGLPARPRHRRHPRRQPRGHRRDPRRPRHHRVGRHERRGRGQLAAGSSSTAQAYIDEHGDAAAVRRAGRRVGGRSPTTSGGPGPRRSRRTCARSRRATTAWSATSPTATSCSTSSPARSCPTLAELGTSCPDHFLRTKVKPLVLDLPPTAPIDDVRRPPGRAARAPTGPTTPPTTSATPRPTRPPMRGADPAIILVPGVGMFSYGKDKQTARVAGEFYVNAINVMRGAEAVSTYAPIPESREVPHRVLGARGGQAPAPAEAEAPRRAHRARHRRGQRHRQGHRHPARRRRRLRGHRRPRRRQGAARRRPSSARPTSPSASRSTSPTPTRCGPPSTPPLLAFGGVDLVVNNAGLSISKPLLETTEARLGPPARRDGQGQLPRVARRRPRR